MNEASIKEKTAGFPALYHAGRFAFLIERPCAGAFVIFWMKTEALYAEANKTDCTNQEVIRPHSSGAAYTLSSITQLGSLPIDPATGGLRLGAPVVRAVPAAHPTKERRLRWIDGRHRTAAFATLGAPILPLACTIEEVPVLMQVEADFAAGLLPGTIQPYDRNLCAARVRWSRFTVVAHLTRGPSRQDDLECRVRRGQFVSRLAQDYPGVCVRFTSDPAPPSAGENAVVVSLSGKEGWAAGLLGIRRRQARRISDAGQRLSQELGL